MIASAGNGPVVATAYGADIALSVPATVGFGFIILSFAVVGTVVDPAPARQRDQGWLFCATALLIAFFNLAGALEAHGLVTNLRSSSRGRPGSA